VLRLSLVVSALATILAALAGVPAGVALALGRFRGRGVVQTLVNTGGQSTARVTRKRPHTARLSPFIA